ncbi:MAG: NAD(P)-dependent oxidoreductase, partial [Vicinamibacterales bacterium]|nr:NAD(P)-dependent oxidoreductase [Vicinamibacterales bacterium]
MALPQIIVTGSSGFVGRHLLEALRDRYRIFGIARRSQARSHAPEHHNIVWFESDVGEFPQIEATFAKIADMGGAETVVHLAAHYDFTGEEDPDYWRTNVVGLRNVLDLSVRMGVRHVVFSSSVAACRLPGPGRYLNEDSPPDGEHIYARTKGEGERMLAEYSDRLSPVIVRFAALFSDWCEYPPLYMFLQTWLSWAWNARILGGKGRSAIPYLHVQDVVLFLEQVLDRLEQFRPAEVLIASPDGCTSHRELFDAATLAYRGARSTPVHVPKPLCGPGMFARDLLGRVLGSRPFERPWMAKYIDTEMRIDASRSRERLDWAPRQRLAILRRMPFLIENFRTDPLEWNRRNREAMKQVHIPDHLRVHWLLQKHEDTIIQEFHALLTGPKGPERFATYQALTPEEHEWHHRLLMRHVLNAVRTRDRGVFMGYCRDLAEHRLAGGFEANELCGALEAFNLVCFRVLRR